MATLTHKSESLVGSVRIAGVATHRACLARVVGVDFYRHTARKRGFVGNVAVQFSESPGRSMSVALALFAGDRLKTFPVLLASMSAPFRAFADMCQVFQAENAVWVRIHDAATDEVIALLFQPSLSSTDDDKASCRGTSAFLLQSLSQSRIMVSFSSNLFATIVLTVLGTITTFSVQPLVIANFFSRPWEVIFPIIGLIGLIGMGYFNIRQRDLAAFFSSGGFILGMLSSAAFSLYPVVLPAVNSANSLTIQNASASQYGQTVGLVWWVIGMILATVYFILMYRFFWGKVYLTGTEGY